jgi:peptidoglycan hydrolase CwlO-like protein
MKDMQSCRDLLRQHMKDCRSDIDEIKERISNLKQVLEEDRRARDRAIMLRLSTRLLVEDRL